MKRKKEKTEVETQAEIKNLLHQIFVEKKYVKAAEELRTRKNVVITALKNIDPDLGVEELTGPSLINALTGCYGGEGLT